MHLILLAYSLLGIVAIRILYNIISTFFSQTYQIPGPALARFTRLWYFQSTWKGTAEKDHIALHRANAKDGAYYAPIVRLGPNMYSIIEPDKQVYGVSSKMPKSDWYDGWQHPFMTPTLFPDKNIPRHNEQRKKFQNLYALSTLKSYEKYVDDCTTIFSKRLDEMSTNGDFVNMGHWFQCYAFDVIGNITYGKRFGFLDQGRDVNDIIAALDSAMVYGTMVGIYAWIHPYLFRLNQKRPGSGAAGRAGLVDFVTKNKAKREAERAQQDVEGQISREEKDENKPEDFLDKILDMKRDQKRGVTDYDCVMLTLSNVFAGSDTTAVSLSSVLYHLIRTPRALKALRDEVNTMTMEGICEPDLVSLEASQKMPYLQACIKEGLRMHAAVGLPLWRVLNENTEISGQMLPAGSWVGISAWVAHYDKDIWGPDVDEFRPERWIEAEKEGSERLRFLERRYLPFGLGSRTCIGRHISLLEMAKVIPQIVRTYDFQLQYPDREWSCNNKWFVKPSNFNVRVSRLEKKE